MSLLAIIIAVGILSRKYRVKNCIVNEGINGKNFPRGHL